MQTKTVARHYQYNMSFETLPRIMKPLYFSRQFQHEWVNNYDIIETSNPMDKGLVNKGLFQDINTLGGLYTHLLLEIYKLIMTEDPSILSAGGGESTNVVPFSKTARLTIARDKIISIMSPYLKHSPLSSTDKNNPVALCAKLSNIRLFVLKEDKSNQKIYDVIYPMTIKPINLKDYRNSFIQRYDAFDITLDFKILVDYDSYKTPNAPNKSYITIPKFLYQELSKLCNDATMLEDFYNLLICSIAINTNQVNRVICSKEKFMSVLPTRWTKFRKDKPLAYKCTVSEIKKRLSTLSDLTRDLKSNLNTDVKLISKVDFPDNRSGSDFIIFYD